MNESLFGFPRTLSSVKQIFLPSNSCIRYDFSPSDVEAIICHSSENSTATFLIPRYPKYNKTVYVANMSSGSTINILIDGNSTPSVSLNYREFVQITCISQLYIISSKGFVRTNKTLLSGRYVETGWITQFQNTTAYNDLCISSENGSNYIYTLSNVTAPYSRNVITKLDSKGSVLWHVMCESSDFNFNSIISSVEEGTPYIYVAGSYSDCSVVAKLTKDADVVWCKRFGAVSSLFYSCCLSYEGQNRYIYAVGKERSTGNYRAYIVKLGTDGSVIWQKTCELSSFNQILASAEGNTNYLYVKSENVIIKHTSDGSVVWSKYPSSGAITSMVRSVENNTVYIYAGHSYSGIFTVVKLTPDGSPVWTKKTNAQGTPFYRSAFVRDRVLICGALRFSSSDYYPYVWTVLSDGSMGFQRYVYPKSGSVISDSAKHPSVFFENGVAYTCFTISTANIYYIMKFCVDFPPSGQIIDIPSLTIYPASASITDNSIVFQTGSYTFSDISVNITSPMLTLIPVKLCQTWSELP